MERFTLPFLLIFSLIASCIEVDISIPSFPQMASFFKVPDGTIQLTLANNLFGFWLSSLFYGPLSESYGRRKIMVWGNALLMIGAFGCVFAPSISWLLSARFIQGLGTSASCVVVFAMISDVYSNQKGVQLIGIMNSLLTILMAAAPIAGGFINESVGWRGNYTVVAVVCIVSWILLLLFLPETKKTREISQIPKVIKDYRTLLLDRRFLYSALVPSLFYASYLSFIACAPFLYLETFKLSAIQYAYHQGFIVAVFSCTSLFSGKALSYLGAKKSINLGLILAACGVIFFAFTSFFGLNSPYLITGFLSLDSLGVALFYPIVFSYSLEIFPNIKGTSSSAIMGMRALLCGGVVGVVSYFYNGHPLSISLPILMVNFLGSILVMKLLCSGEFDAKAA